MQQLSLKHLVIHFSLSQLSLLRTLLMSFSAVHETELTDGHILMTPPLSRCILFPFFYAVKNDMTRGNLGVKRLYLGLWFQRDTTSHYKEGRASVRVNLRLEEEDGWLSFHTHIGIKGCDNRKQNKVTNSQSQYLPVTYFPQHCPMFNKFHIYPKHHQLGTSYLNTRVVGNVSHSIHYTRRPTIPIKILVFENNIMIKENLHIFNINSYLLVTHYLLNICF